MNDRLNDYAGPVYALMAVTGLMGLALIIWSVS